MFADIWTLRLVIAGNRSMSQNMSYWRKDQLTAMLTAGQHLLTSGHDRPRKETEYIVFGTTSGETERKKNPVFCIFRAVLIDSLSQREVPAQQVCLKFEETNFRKVSIIC